MDNFAIFCLLLLDASSYHHFDDLASSALDLLLSRVGPFAIFCDGPLVVPNILHGIEFSINLMVSSSYLARSSLSSQSTPNLLASSSVLHVMDLHAPASPSWDRNGNAYHQPVHDIFDSSSLILSDSPAFQPSYHDPFTTMENKAQPSSEISMGNNETELHSAPSIRGAQMDARPTRRARSDRLDWDACKDTIKELYIDQNKSLSETMAVMRKEYSFNAS